MTSSPGWGFGPHGRSPDAEFDLLVQDPPPPAYVPQQPHPAAEPYEADTDPTDHPEADTFVYAPEDDQSEVGEYATSAGLPGRGVFMLATVAAAGCAALDFALTGQLTIFFDLCFVVVCLVAAMGVQRHDLFTAGVLPPLVFGLIIGGVAVLAPTVFVAAEGLSATFLSGLAQHATSLVAGYAVALLTVGGRVIASR